MELCDCECVCVRLFGDSIKDVLPLTDFLATVGSLKFRGTSVLFRLPRSALSHLLTRFRECFACTSLSARWRSNILIYW